MDLQTSMLTFGGEDENDGDDMKALILFVFWCLLFVLCWPVAVLALILLPLVWLVSLPIRLIGVTVEAVFALLRALLFLPARLLGWKRRGRQVA
jgi:hypothetical protein